MTTSHGATRTEPAHTTGTGHPGPVHTNPEEVTAVQLTQLIDMHTVAGTTDAIPCRENDAELWFTDTPDGVEFAKTLCVTCPVRAACLASAIERREPWGVWGGELFEQGAVIPRKRPRGRPRKDSIAA